MHRIFVGSILLLVGTFANCTIADSPDNAAGGAGGTPTNGGDTAGEPESGSRAGSPSSSHAGAPSVAGSPSKTGSLHGDGGAGGATAGAGGDNAAGTAGEPNAPQPSCVGLEATCGAQGDDSCCAAAIVPGGKFNRSNDAASPATLSSFRLDSYEVTVGRFKRFVAAYAKDMLSAGAGENPNSAADLGWNPAWNAKLPKDATALKASLLCDLTTATPSNDAYNTWTSGDDNKPINCVDWYVSNAFCTWDGGRLPTEAEWNYAAAGGAEQRKYPWGVQEPGADAKRAAYQCYYGSNGACIGVANFAEVGSIAANRAKWGQFDMAGNVWEWTLDGYDAYAKPCVDCTELGATAERVYRGGGFVDNSQSLTTAYRGHYPSHYSYNIGIRCARSVE